MVVGFEKVFCCLTMFGNQMCDTKDIVELPSSNRQTHSSNKSMKRSRWDEGHILPYPKEIDNTDNHSHRDRQDRQDERITTLLHDEGRQ